MRRIFVLAIALFWSAQLQAAEITVSGAASLTNAFNEINKAFEKAHPDIQVNTNYAASNPLLKQIIEGAPVDVFASADQETMDRAEKAKVVDGRTRRDFAANELVLIVPSGSEKPGALAELGRLTHIAIGNPDSVPAGRYTRAALKKAHLWEKLEPKFIQAASVRQVLDYVARGEVDAGFVYATDARQRPDRVEIVMAVKGHDPVTYPVAVALTGANAQGGQEFIDFLLSAQGQEILKKYGFSGK